MLTHTQPIQLDDDLETRKDFNEKLDSGVLLDVSCQAINICEEFEPTVRN